MAHQELRVFTVNMKSLDQDIEDPIIAGAGDANGRTFRIIFTQEAAAQFTPETKVYLKWYHQELDIKGYNIFNHVQDDPPIWEIKYPRNMLHEGNVLCCIEIVDDISISPSTNFIVHVLTDPNDGSSFVVSDDYSIFQQAVIDLATTNDKAKDQLESQQKDFESMQQEFDTMKDKIDEAYDKANAAYNIAKDAINQVIEKDTSLGVWMTEY